MYDSQASPLKNVATPTYFLFAGEPSGDLHGSHLIRALKEKSSRVTFIGVGGPKMRNQGLNPLLKMENFEVMGFLDVLLSLPKMIKQFYIVRNSILKQNPEVVILIDYPDFNLRLAKALRKKGYGGKIVHYISPSVWAWRNGRIHSMAETLDLLMTIYPFEKAYFNKTTLKVDFVGNPLSEYIGKYLYNPKWKEQLGIPSAPPLIALFPGSRQSEIERHFQLQLQAAELFLAQIPDHIFGISCTGEKQEMVIRKMVENSQLELGKQLFIVPSHCTYELMRDAKAAIAKSGTVTLELALHHCPTVVIYHLAPLNHFIAKWVMKLQLPHYCIVNILAERKIFPELIEHGLTSENIYQELIKLDLQGDSRDKCLEGCKEVSNLLDTPNASQKAAMAVLETMQ